MRAKCALYVDAGYLLASAATRITGTSFRNGVHVQFGKLIDAVLHQAEEISGLPALRVHWYDSAKDGVPDAQQERIGELAKVKLRLGRFGVDGQQKGVDLRIGLDLVAHARNGAADVFLLVSGDDDLTEAVEEAQVHGVEVVVLAVPDASGRPHGVSRHLVRAADQVITIHDETIDNAVLKVEQPDPVAPPQPIAPERPAVPSPMDLARRTRTEPAPPAPTSSLAYSSSTGLPGHLLPQYVTAADVADEIDTVVRQVVASVTKSATLADLATLQRGRPSLPRDVDRALMLDMSAALGSYDLNDDIRFRMRDRFWELLDERD